MRRSSVAVALVALGFSAASLYLAVPRSIAGGHEFATRGYLSALRRGSLIPAAGQDRLIESRARADRWIVSGEHKIDSAFVMITRRFSRARQLGGKLPDEDRFRPIERRLEAGLSISPVNSDGWRWLAVARMTHKDAKGAATALRMSLFTGPHQRLLAVSRLRLLMQTWDQFSVDERKTIYQQIRFAWRVAPNGVLNLAMDSQHLWPFRIALAARPRDLKFFQHRLKRLKAKAARERQQ